MWSIVVINEELYYGKQSQQAGHVLSQSYIVIILCIICIRGKWRTWLVLGGCRQVRVGIGLQQWLWEEEVGRHWLHWWEWGYCDNEVCGFGRGCAGANEGPLDSWIHHIPCLTPSHLSCFPLIDLQESPHFVVTPKLSAFCHFIARQIPRCCPNWISKTASGSCCEAGSVNLDRIRIKVTMWTRSYIMYNLC